MERYWELGREGNFRFFVLWLFFQVHILFYLIYFFGRAMQHAGS